jgi:FtsH-binding integral membrane protein
MNFNHSTDHVRTQSDVSVDTGLRSHMQSIYNRMTLGVLVTALTAWLVSSVPSLMALFLAGPQAILVMFAPMMIMWFGFRPERMDSKKLQIAFLAIAAVYGISFSVIALYFAKVTIVRAFLMTSILFASISIYGYTSRKNLTALGTFSAMGIMSIFILSIGTLVAGMFGIDTTAMQTIISAFSLLFFSGLTAWQTQAMKESYNVNYGKETNSRMAWAAALNLYISFVAMFQSILHLTSGRGE